MVYGLSWVACKLCSAPLRYFDGVLDAKEVNGTVRGRLLPLLLTLEVEAEWTSSDCRLSIS